MTPRRERALVLGGGGEVGISWELGILTALAENGIDLTTADYTVGTSAGAVVGAQLGRGRPVAELLTNQTATTLPRYGPPPRAEAVADMTTTWARLTAEIHDPRERVQRLAARALTAHTKPESDHRAEVGVRIGHDDWPTTPLAITALNARSGELRILERSSGVGLVDAVAASAAIPLVWPPITLDADRYIDGGMLSATNAHLAAGYQCVVILAPAVDPRLAEHLNLLRKTGHVHVIDADPTSRNAFGRNATEHGTRVKAARAGVRQGRLEADAVATMWWCP